MTETCAPAARREDGGIRYDGSPRGWRTIVPLGGVEISLTAAEPNRLRACGSLAALHPGPRQRRAADVVGERLTREQGGKDLGALLVTELDLDAVGPAGAELGGAAATTGRWFGHWGTRPVGQRRDRGLRCPRLLSSRLSALTSSTTPARLSSATRGPGSLSGGV